jgi:peptidoglycan hydrolase-like protein with peptidoglycan-binding domain
MSTTIDQRVVQMQFDNRHFENNVATTMSTLDKLKQKLHLDGAVKGFDNINAAAKNVNMSPLGSAVEAVSVKFSVLQVMGVTALANLTNSAVNAGKNIVKSLTIDPVKSGFSEYELKMGSIQTIMAGTGESLGTVNKYLNELNKYSDDTIYSFQDMTSNIGKFTNAGVKLEDAVLAIKGISNEAALSGANANEASRAMYNFSQALSAGFVKLVDWKSIELANMATKGFKEELIKTAVEVGTLKKGADGMYDVANVISKANATSLNATKNFNDSLGNQWMTTEVLIETLRRYADENTEIGKRAAAAATEVKTFTMLMDTLKEAAQSGWAQTWELLVGDFEEAKAFFTELSNIFGGILGKSADRRNTFLGDTLTSNWDKLIDKINEAGIETSKFEESIRKVVGDNKLDALVKEYGSLDKAAKKGAISSDDLKKALDNIAGTNADNKLSGFVDSLKEIERTLRRGNVGDDVKKLQTALDSLGYDLGKRGVDGIIGPATEKAIKAFQEANGLIADGVVGPKTMKALEEAGAKVEKTAKDVDGLKESCGSLIDVITEASGRELILDSVLNVIKAIQRPLEAVGEAIRNTFSITSDQLYGVLKKVNDFTKKLVPKGILDIKSWPKLLNTIGKFGIKITDFTKKLTEVLKTHGIDVDALVEKYGHLGKAFEAGAISFDYIKEALLSFDGVSESLINGGEVADKIRRTFEGLLAVVDILATVLAGPIKFAFSITTKVLKKLGLSILDVTANIGDAIVKFRDNVNKVVNTITDFIVDNIAEWIKQFRETEFFKTCAGWIEDASQTISDAISSITDKMGEFNTSTAVERLKSFGSFVSDIAHTISNSEIFIAIIDGICGAFARLKEFFGGFKLPEFNLDNFKKLLNIGGLFEDGKLPSFFSVFDQLRSYFTGKTAFNWDTFKNNAIQKFTEFWLKTGDKVKKAFEVCKEIATAIKTFIFGTGDLTLPTILELVEKFMGIVLLMKALTLLDTIVTPFDNITDTLNNFATSLKWDAISTAFKSMALALGVFTVCIVILTNLPDPSAAWQAVGMLAALMAIMGTIVVSMAFFAGKVGSGKDAFAVGASLFLIVGALALLLYTVKELDKLELKDASRTFNMLGAMLVALTIGVGLVAKAGSSSFKSVAAILTLVAALKLILDVVTAYDEYDWTGKRGAIYKMANMLVALSIAINIASRGIGENSSAKGLALAILAMVISLKMLLGVIDDFAAMDTDKLIKGGAVVITLMAVMTLMAAVLNASSDGTVLQKGERSANNFTGLAVALLAVVAAIWLLGKMATTNMDMLQSGGRAVAQILLLFTGMLAAVGLATKGLKMGSVITMLIAFGLLLAEMTLIIKYLESVPWQNSLSSAGALAGLLLAMALMMRTMRTGLVKPTVIVKWIGTLAALSGVIWILAGVLNQMKDIAPQSAIGSAAALGLLLTVIAHSMLTLTKYDVSSGNIFKCVMAMGALGLIVGELAFVLYSIKKMDPLSAIGNAVALGALLLALTGTLAILNTVKVDSGVLKSIGLLAVLSLTLFLLVGVLQSMNNVENAISNAIALSTLASALSVCTIPLAAASKIAPTAVVGVTALVALAVVLGLLVWGLSAITGIETAQANAKTLANLAVVLSLCTLPLAVASVIAPLAIVGAGLLAALAVVLGLLVWGLSAIKDTETARSNVVSMILLIASLANVVMMLGSLGLDSLTAVAALNALIILVGKLGVLAAAVGLLTGDGALIDDGLAMLQKIAGGLGKIVSSFALGLTSDLPAIAENLSAFVEKAGPFVSLVSGIGEDVATGAGNLASAILALLAADFLAGIANMVDISLIDLATELRGFAVGVMPFVFAMRQIKPEIATGIKALCDGISALTGATFWNGINDLIFGEGSLSSFGESIKGFATCIKDAAAALSDITDDDVENIKRSATAGEALADLNAAIPAQGGIWQSIAGEKDLASWGTKISAFADSLVAYSAKVSGKNIDSEAIAKSAEAAIHVSDLNSAIPAAGGIWQSIAGEQDLANWGTKIVAFADALVNYSAKVSGKSIDKEAILQSADAASALSEVNKAIPASDGIWQWFTGEQDLTTFGSGLVSLAEGIVAYATAATSIGDDEIKAIENTGTAIEKIKMVVEKIPSTGGLGGALFGDKDPKAFGEAIYTLAYGIKSCCYVAATVTTDSIEKISNIGTAVDEITAVINDIPTVDVNQAQLLKSAVTHIQAMCTTLHAMSIAGYNFSAVGSLKGVIAQIVGMLDSISVDNMFTDFRNVRLAVQEAVATAEAAASLNSYTYGGVDTLKGALDNLSKANVDGVIDAFSGKSDSMRVAVNSLVSAMSSGINSASDKVATEATNVINKAITSIGNKASEFQSLGRRLTTLLAHGLRNGSGLVHSIAGIMGTQAVTAVRSKHSAMYTAGMYLVYGFGAGISRNTWYAEAKATAMANAAEKAAKAALDINSPSKVFRTIGYSVPEGFAMGIDKMSGLVKTSSVAMAQSAIGNVRNTISRISDMVSMDVDSQPTIRPVLDLSDVRSGVSTMSGMLNMDSSVGVRANIGAISSMMNMRSQNGSNSDVVSAIDKLRKDLGNIGGDTYQINGVTYDDGSNINDAVRTLVRAARIERRV